MSAEYLGPYRLLSPLGSGGFGEVHLALDGEGRTVAVKVLHPHVAGDASALARLAREVETMRRVRGPHVAEVLDAALNADRPYLVTRYVQGRALSAVVAEGPLRGDDLVRLARGLAEALVAVHRAGVVHRDLKPGNVILADGEPHVIDFGVAYALDSAAVTASGAVVGTPGYLAPEVLEGREAGSAADVFAWAATVAFAATGRHPYGTGPMPAVAYRVVHGEPDLDGVPDWLAPLLRQCMKAEPAARPSAAELVTRLGSRVPERATVVVPEGGPREELTQEWRPGMTPERRAPAEDPLARRREVVRRRWVVGSGLVVGLLAATGREYVPEASLLLLVAYGVVVLADAGFGVAAKATGRVVVDFASIAGAVALWAVLSTVFSTFTLLLAVGTLLFLLGLVAVAG
ncbi:serine/threonine-protein kinase [Acrocarpospora catenulata]|uniref:serine/threonine-protein kinase n=1 Tax=Acrocarpospora catenulata TaxID=2836182 RepID=UPI001BDB3F8F|nr:serine/threonine-protein kinase [Acrocarpospora catenulata]